MKPEWLTADDVVALHDEAIAAFGGLPGVRDVGLLEGVVARPRNLRAYGNPSIFDLAASYSVGIAKSHPFADGNKRTAFLAAAVFLDLNSHPVDPSEGDVVDTMLQVARGDLDERGLSQWLKANAKKRRGRAHR